MLIRGDARALPVAAGTVQCVVTSPPYWGLRDYGIDGQLGLEKTPEEYVGGMTLIEVADDAEAVTWASRIAQACGWPQEMRRFKA